MFHNMYLSPGVAPIPKLLKAGVTCSLGVDGAASNNANDMIELMKNGPAAEVRYQGSAIHVG